MHVEPGSSKLAFIASSYRRWDDQIEELLPQEFDEIRRHYQRLDEAGLRARFGHGISHQSLTVHLERALREASVIFACRISGQARGIDELHLCGKNSAAAAEAAFSVERLHRNNGIGTALMAAVLAAARARRVRHVIIPCDWDNRCMQRIARKFAGALDFVDRECTAIVPPVS